MFDISKADPIIQGVVARAVSFALRKNEALNVTERAILSSIVGNTEATVILHECGGDLIKAINEYRKQTGANLKDAKAAIDEAIKQQRSTATVILHKCGGDIIKSIKEYRTQTGANLKDARAAIDEIVKQQRSS